MKHLVIACCSNVITGALTDALKPKYIVHTCKSSDELTVLLDTYHPCVLIISLFLHGSDGIAALNSCKYKPSIVLALTYVISQSIMNDARNAGIQELILLPCTIKHILNRLDILIHRINPTD